MPAQQLTLIDIPQRSDCQESQQRNWQRRAHVPFTYPENMHNLHRSCRDPTDRTTMSLLLRPERARTIPSFLSLSDDLDPLGAMSAGNDCASAFEPFWAQL